MAKAITIDPTSKLDCELISAAFQQ